MMAPSFAFSTYILMAVLDFRNATAGTTYSQSNSYYTGNNVYGNIYTNTSSYSPALANIQYQ